MLRFLTFLLLSGGLLAACSTANKGRKPPRKASVAKPSKTSVPPAAPIPASGNPAPILSGASAGIAWLESERLMPVLEQAQRLQKPVFLEFHASWCAPCKMLERDVFSSPDVYEFLNRHFLSYRVDTEANNGAPIAQIYEVTGLPTLLFVDPKGVVMERSLGLTTESHLLKLANSALAKMR